jgi:RNA polymerase sigma factor (sigma-70 family)
MIDIEESYKSVEKIFYLVAHEFSHDQNEIDEMVSVATLHWLRMFHKYKKQKAALTTWTHLIARGAIMREWARLHRRKRMPQIGKAIFSFDESKLGILEEPIDRELLDKIWAYIDYRFEPRTSEILHQIFEYGAKQVDIAADTGLTKQRISQIVAAALADIREWCAAKVNTAPNAPD